LEQVPEVQWVVQLVHDRITQPQGAIIGAAIGGTAGALIGKYMDRQAEELEEDLEGAEVERVGEGIKVTFDSGILFNFDSSELTPSATENIENLAGTLKKYEDTNILIEGHTDSQGSEKYNQKPFRGKS
jgi:outer membrane protein OmpA-like peptidoglycan-associated protein